MRLTPVLALAVLLIAQPSSIAAQAADPVAALSGDWKLNVQASTNPNGPEGSGAPARRRPLVGINDLMVHDILPEHIAPFREHEPIGREELQRFSAQVAMFRKAPPVLGIQATATDVVFAFDPDPAKGPIYKYTIDNRKSVMVTLAGPVDVKVTSNGKALRREIESRESLKVVEEYTPGADGKQLIVTVETRSSLVRMDKVEIKRVYDRIQ
jgi:hypothetical protein